MERREAGNNAVHEFRSRTRFTRGDTPTPLPGLRLVATIADDTRPPPPLPHSPFTHSPLPSVPHLCLPWPLRLPVRSHHERLEGHRGAYLLRRDTGDHAEFMAVTLWDSLQSIRAFAGDSLESAVVEPEARAVLSSFDDFVTHYEVVHGHPCAGATP